MCCETYLVFSLAGRLGTFAREKWVLRVIKSRHRIRILNGRTITVLPHNLSQPRAVREEDLICRKSRCRCMERKLLAHVADRSVVFGDIFGATILIQLWKVSSVIREKLAKLVIGIEKRVLR